MPVGGRLTIETANLDLASTGVPGYPDMAPGSFVRITVSDTGLGMDAATLARVFEPFFTTKPKGQGTGMGLATAYGIVAQSGGRIACTSEPGHGARFTIDLPRIDAPIAGAANPGSEAPAPRGSETILLVEDQDAVRSLSRRVLARLGYTVLESASGAEALALADTSDARIDLLLTDIMMPGIQGDELAKRMRATRPETRMLLMSGFTPDRLDGGEPGSPVFPILNKPFDLRALANAVRDALDGPPLS